MPFTGQEMGLESVAEGEVDPRLHRLHNDTPARLTTQSGVVQYLIAMLRSKSRATADLAHMTGGTTIPRMARVRISSLLTTATVASKKRFRSGSASFRMG